MWSRLGVDRENLSPLASPKNLEGRGPPRFSNESQNRRKLSGRVSSRSEARLESISMFLFRREDSRRAWRHHVDLLGCEAKALPRRVTLPIQVLMEIELAGMCGHTEMCFYKPLSHAIKNWEKALIVPTQQLDRYRRQLLTPTILCCIVSFFFDVHSPFIISSITRFHCAIGQLG